MIWASSIDRSPSDRANEKTDACDQRDRRQRMMLRFGDDALQRIGACFGGAPCGCLGGGNIRFVDSIHHAFNGAARESIVAGRTVSAPVRVAAESAEKISDQLLHLGDLGCAG
jgi:hypothetical protein